MSSERMRLLSLRTEALWDGGREGDGEGREGQRKGGKEGAKEGGREGGRERGVPGGCKAVADGLRIANSLPSCVHPVFFGLRVAEGASSWKKRREGGREGS
jgi:hypothetical protein